MSISTADAFDSNQKSYSGMIQKNLILDKQGETAIILRNSWMHTKFHCSQEARMFPVSNQPNQTIMVLMSSPFLHSHLGSTEQNVISSAINRQPLGGVPVISPVYVVPSTSSVDLRQLDIFEMHLNTSKLNGAPAQVTIFYNGYVCVYDDVSLEAQVPASIHKPSIGDGYIGINSHITSPCSGLSSPISVTSHVGSQSAAGPSCSNYIARVRPIGVLASSNNQPEPSKAVSTVGAPPTTLIPAACKASFPQFLEKRKER
ncbi:hypothetical protein Ddye_030194 [Dipteronia dyeriana]|uniref:Protein TIFY n=1 Tax=Dipteronia dyeriana TaxID=168575 RepID=A0AAD9WM89_9ROSI|nr:hypothetical protein Ddye_030194 [Dipteronia dyeriana]